MRKFRGQTEKGNFVYGYLNYSEQEDIYYIGVMEFMIPVKPETIGQLTGLHDMYEKEVYEGDILKAYGYGNLSGKWEVKFVDGEWKALSINNLGFSLDAKYFEHTELIGNIYENPELI